MQNEPFLRVARHDRTCRAGPGQGLATVQDDIGGGQPVQRGEDRIGPHLLPTAWVVVLIAVRTAQVADPRHMHGYRVVIGEHSLHQ